MSNHINDKTNDSNEFFSNLENETRLFGNAIEYSVVDDDNLFLDEDDIKDEGTHKVWKILIVDDEEDVHAMTRLSLKGFVYNNTKLEFTSAYSAESAKHFLLESTDYAIIFLDVVMESNEAGLDLVKYIRSDLSNNLIQIILRTGQPGYAPEKTVIQDYNINDYQTKSELTEAKLFTITTSSLRSYEALKSVKKYSISLEKKVEARTGQLKEKNEQLEKLFSIISHDLRGPIGNIDAILNLITTEEFPEKEINKFLSVMKKLSASTYSLLENLLLWANSNKGSQYFNTEIVAIKPIIDSNFALLTTIAAIKSIDLVTDVNESIAVYADKNMVTTIIRNLIANAIKFTGENGEIRISAKIKENNLEIAISDNGIGIKKENLDKIFGKQNFTTYGTNGEKGSGLGLQLCQEFVVKNGGEIWVESVEEQGTTFFFTLPVIH